jgi:hypothetical protein
MSKRDASRELYAALQEQGLLEYGSTIETWQVHHLLGIEMPTVGTKAVFDRIAVQELAAVDYVRNILLGQGKYLMGTSTGYRVLLPSENKGQIDSYIESADRKLSRALKLSRNTPADPAFSPDQVEARIHMKRNKRRGVGE